MLERVRRTCISPIVEKNEMKDSEEVTKITNQG